MEEEKVQKIARESASFVVQPATLPVTAQTGEGIKIEAESEIQDTIAEIEIAIEVEEDEAEAMSFVVILVEEEVILQGIVQRKETEDTEDLMEVEVMGVEVQ